MGRPSGILGWACKLGWPGVWEGAVGLSWAQPRRWGRYFDNFRIQHGGPSRIHGVGRTHGRSASRRIGSHSVRPMAWLVWLVLLQRCSFCIRPHSKPSQWMLRVAVVDYHRDYKRLRAVVSLAVSQNTAKCNVLRAFGMERESFPVRSDH